MQLYFVRHAQSEGNAKGYLSTVDSDKLSPLGHEQAEALAMRLKDFNFDHVYVSSCCRTLQTIAPYLRNKKQKAEVWSDLSEACWQSDIDKPIPERKGSPDPVTIPDELTEHYIIPEDRLWAPWGEETYKEGALRVEAARDEILKRHTDTDDQILVVGHYNSGSRLLELLMGLTHSRRVDHDNTGLTCLRQNDDGSFSVNFANRM